MTINDLIKIIPKEYYDKMISIDIPFCRDGDQGYYPLIQVEIDQQNRPKEIRIILIADF